MLQQFFHILIFNAFLFCILLHESIYRNNQSGYKLTLIGDNGNLIDITVNNQLRFQSLRSDIFTIRCFEQVFNAFRQEKLAILKVACISCVEPSIRFNSCSGSFRFLIIAFCDRFPPKQDLIIFTYFHFNSRQYDTYRTYIIANRQCTGYSSR